MSVIKVVIFVFAIFMIAHGQESSPVKNAKNSRLFSLFQILRFPNDPCTGTGANSNGTCYTRTECASYNGTVEGTCASGFGVCCIVSRTTCNAETSRNATYWASSLSGTGSCTLTIKDIPENVCQIRLELITFQLSSPLSTAAGSNTVGTCVDDMFTATKLDIGMDNHLCGFNSGQHVYLHTGKKSSDVKLTVTAVTANTNRQWNIQPLFIECDSPLRAPDGCAQYFIGETGQVKSFNFPTDTTSTTDVHLKNQDYRMCFRSEEDKEDLRLQVCDDNSFVVTGDAGAAGASGLGSGVGQHQCGQLGPASTAPFDSLLIPCARLAAGEVGCPASRFCGTRLNPGTANIHPATGTALTTNAAVYTALPAVLQFISDGDEVDAMLATSADFTTTVVARTQTGNRGFCLNYVQV